MIELKFKKNIHSKIDFINNENKEIEIQGMIQNLRILSWGGFLILRTPVYTIQTVVDTNFKKRYSLLRLFPDNRLTGEGFSFTLAVFC